MRKHLRMYTSLNKYLSRVAKYIQAFGNIAQRNARFWKRRLCDDMNNVAQSSR